MRISNVADAAVPATTSDAADRPLIQRLRTGGLWILGGRTLGMGMVLLINMVLARILSEQAFAAYGLASTVVVFTSMVAMFGQNTLACRYLAESFGVGDAVRARRALVAVACVSAATISLVGLVSAPIIRLLARNSFDQPLLVGSAGLIAVWIMLLAVSQVLAEVFRGLHDLRMTSILGGVSGGLASSALFLGAIFVARFVVELSFNTIVVLAVMSFVLPIAAAAWFLRRAWRDSVPRHASAAAEHDLEPVTARAMLREGFPIMLVLISGFGLAQLDMWIVGVYDKSEFAVYYAVRRVSFLVAVPLTQVGLAVSSSISELYARRDTRRLEQVLRGAATVSTLMTFVFIFLLVVFPAEILNLLFGSRLGAGAAGAWPLRILCIGQIIFCLTGPCGPALMMTGRQRITLCSLLASLPVFLLGPLAIARYGLAGMAVVSAAVMAVQNILQWWAAKRLLGVGTHPSLSPRFVVDLVRILRSGKRT